MTESEKLTLAHLKQGFDELWDDAEKGIMRFQIGDLTPAQLAALPRLDSKAIMEFAVRNRFVSENLVMEKADDHPAI